MVGPVSKLANLAQRKVLLLLLVLLMLPCRKNLKASDKGEVEARVFYMKWSMDTGSGRVREKVWVSDSVFIMWAR